MNKRYSVLTFIFDNYENVREVQNPQEDVDYILVTDDCSLKSQTWRIIVDKELDGMQPFEKCCHVRYNLFKYAKTEICIHLDGSMQVKGSFDKLISDFVDSGADLALMPHPLISTYVPELQIWVQQRNYPVDRADKFLKFLKEVNYDLNYRSHFIVCIQVRKNNKLNSDYQSMMLSFLNYLSDEAFFERNDQLVSDYVLNMFFNKTKIFPLAYNAIQNSAVSKCDHGSSNECEVPFSLIDPAIDHYAYVFNQKVKCYNLI